MESIRSNVFLGKKLNQKMPYLYDTIHQILFCDLVITNKISSIAMETKLKQKKLSFIKGQSHVQKRQQNKYI